jgi:hypothetical protein
VSVALGRTPADRLQAGRDALARGAWREAPGCFKQALEDEVTPEAPEGLGMAAFRAKPTLRFGHSLAAGWRDRHTP